MARRSALVALAAVGAMVGLPRLVGAQQADGFDGYVQSGSCASPTDDLRTNLVSEGADDVQPYLAKAADGSDDTVFLGYYGSPGLPGFGFSAIYTDQPYSLVISDTESGDPVACGDILEPDADRFGEAGLALVQLLPVGDSDIQGVAAIQRARLQREEVVTPTRVRILLSEGVSVDATGSLEAGYDGYVQPRRCAEPTERAHSKLKSRGDHDVRPYLAKAEGSGDPVTVAYYGAPRAPGFGLAAAYTDRDFAVVITDTEGGTPVACGDILIPDDDQFTDAGVALVQLLPSGGSGVQGYALIERIDFQRESDVTPTRIRVLLFAPAVSAP